MERINNRISQAIMETCLAMTIFRCGAPRLCCSSTQLHMHMPDQTSRQLQACVLLVIPVSVPQLVPAAEPAWGVPRQAWLDHCTVTRHTWDKRFFPKLFELHNSFPHRG